MLFFLISSIPFDQLRSACFFLFLLLLGPFTYKASSLLSINTHVTNAPEVISNFRLKYFLTHTSPDNIEAGKY